MKSPYDVIIKPVITEKTMAITEEGKYTFIVAPDAEKPEIKAAAEKLFGVKVVSVNIANYDGKVKRLRNKPGKTPAFKKAVVTIATESVEGTYLRQLRPEQRTRHQSKNSVLVSNVIKERN